MFLFLHGQPVTKKNSRRIYDSGTGKKIVLPSKAFADYMEACLWQIPGAYRRKITGPVRIEYRYFMRDEKSSDLDNLIVGTNDILVAGEIIPDDGRKYIREIKASFGETDKKDPRVEIFIMEE